MPLIHSRITNRTYAGLVDKVSNRLASWKSKHLSMAGRLTLVQAVTSSVPIYAMQTAKLPSAICEKLDKLNRNFLWGDTNERKKIHLLNWKKVCKPKDMGGLGLKRSTDMNCAMLAKASWRIVQKDDGLWSQVFEKKYLKNKSILDSNYNIHTGCSSTWSSVIHGAKLLRTGIIWRVGNGCTIKFWKDNWTGLGTLSPLALHTDFIDEDALVQDFWCHNGWDCELLNACLPSHIVAKILTIPISCDANVGDKIIWNPTSNGNFSVRSAYDLSIAIDTISTVPWKGIWSFNIPPKLKIFAWIVAQGRLLTNVQRCIRHISSDPCCNLCPGIEESMLHLLRDCPAARKVWDAIKIPIKLQNFFQLDWNEWISDNLLMRGVYWDTFSWNNCFLVICWYIWKWRNKGIFEAQFQVPKNPLQIILHYTTEWFSISRNSSSCEEKQEVFLRWLKPPRGSFKLNVDGSRSTHCLSGAGGVIRNWSGDWIKGFTHHIGEGEVLQAELWGIFIGLKLAADLCIKKLEVESDSAVAVNLINSVDHDLHPMATIIGNCRFLMQLFYSCHLSHIHRERNAVADILAKDSLSQQRGTLFFDSPPAHIAQTAFGDITGNCCMRRMSLNRHCDLFPS